MTVSEIESMSYADLKKAAAKHKIRFVGVTKVNLVESLKGIAAANGVPPAEGEITPVPEPEVGSVKETKSGKIRELLAKGVSRKEIAEKLGVRQQFISNVYLRELEAKEGQINS